MPSPGMFTPSFNEVPSFEDIVQARKRLDGHVLKTPVFTNSEIDQLTGRQIYFKAENLQKTGSFKFRGAFNSVAYLNDSLAGGLRRVVTISCGNHGLALATTCSHFNVPLTVYVPPGSSECKIAFLKSHGAEVVVCEEKTFSNAAAKLEFFKNLTRNLLDGECYVSPSGGKTVIAGQGTVGLEFMDQVPDLDAILVSVGGGGLLGGVALAVSEVDPSIKVYAVEPKGKNLQENLKRGYQGMAVDPHVTSPRIDTIAEGLRRKYVNHGIFKNILLNHIQREVFTVTDQQTVDATKLVFEKLKLVIEVTAGTGVAAALSQQLQMLDPSIKKIGVILCGGNAELDDLPWIQVERK